MVHKTYNPRARALVAASASPSQARLAKASAPKQALKPIYADGLIHNDKPIITEPPQKSNRLFLAVLALSVLFHIGTVGAVIFMQGGSNDHSHAGLQNFTQQDKAYQIHYAPPKPPEPPKQKAKQAEQQASQLASLAEPTKPPLMRPMPQQRLGQLASTTPVAQPQAAPQAAPHAAPQAAPPTPKDITQDMDKGQAGYTASSFFKLGSKNQPLPPYPLMARKQGWQGLVVLQAGLDGKTNKPTEVAVTRSSGFSILDSAALTTVQDWLFTLPKEQNITYPLTIEIPIRFQLGS